MSLTQLAQVTHVAQEIWSPLSAMGADLTPGSKASSKQQHRISVSFNKEAKQTTP